MKNLSMIVSWTRVVRAPLLLFGAVLALGDAAYAETKLTISHPEVAPPTLVDLGEPGESVGDMRLFNFNGVADDGRIVQIDWIMTTTGVDVPAKGVDSRVSTGTFLLSEDPTSQLILQGVAFYPGKDATLEVSSSTVRVISGGSGQFAGARGWVESIHLEDGSWQHIFHFE